jgi:hypothetical protein
MFNSYQPTSRDGTKTPRATRKAGVAAAALSLGLAALPLAAAPAANAAELATVGPCTVTAGKPYFVRIDPLTSKKVVAYPISADCTRSDVAVIMKQIIQEDDPDYPWNPNDVLKSWYTPAETPLKFSAPGKKWVTPMLVLTSTGDEGGTPEEVFHRVQFRVTSNGVTAGPITVTSRNFSIWP